MENYESTSQINQAISKNIYKFCDVENLSFDKNFKDILDIFYIRVILFEKLKSQIGKMVTL